MECNILIKETGQVISKDDLATIISDLEQRKASGELENYEEALKQELILYDLGKSEGLDLQQKTIDILLSNSVEMTHDNQEKDEVFEENRPLDDSRVTDRATIVVKKGSVRPFDKDEWRKKTKNSLKDRLKNKHRNMDETELDELVDNSFVEIDRFNDETADVGTDIHKVAEIIFANDLKSSGETIKYIENNNIEFKTDPFKRRDNIFDGTLNFIFAFKRDLMNTYKGCKFLTEIGFIQSKLNTDGTYASIKSDTLRGIIDLVMVDANGGVHIFDFKSSASAFAGWSSFKKERTMTQLYIYKKMLESLNLDVKTLRCVAIPYDIDKDTYNDGDKRYYSYRLKNIKKYDPTTSIVRIDHVPKSGIVDVWFPNKYNAPKPEEWLETERTMNQVFILEEEQENVDNIDVDYYFDKDENGNYVPNEQKLAEFRFYAYPKDHVLYDQFKYCYRMGKEPLMRCRSVEDLRLKLKDSLERLSSSKLAQASRLAHAFAEEYKKANGKSDKINYSNILGPNTDQHGWLKGEIRRYLDSGDFELHTDHTYLDQGYLLWKHKTLGFVECVLISSDNIMHTRKLAKGTTILGKILDDGHVDKKEVMTANNGNIAMMKFMNFLATSPNTRKWCTQLYNSKGEEQTCKIASIRVISPYSQAKEIRPNLKFVVDNYELLCANSNRLLKSGELKKLDLNLFYNDPQSLALQAVAQCDTLVPIYKDFDTTKFSYDYERVDDVLAFVNECLNKMISSNNKVHYEDLAQFDPSDPNWRAIFYLINIRNTLHGHTYIAELGQGKWFSGNAPTGLMIAAPGMSTSTTIRTFDEINKAYVDSVIQAVNKYGKDGKQACINMYVSRKMDKLLGGPGNASAYIDLFETNEHTGALTQQFMLKDPINSKRLSSTQREVIKEFMILNYRLTTLAQGSKKGLEPLSEETKKEIFANHEWRMVPLMDAAFSRQLYNHHKSSNNWLKTIRYACVNKWRELGNIYNDIMIDDVEVFNDNIHANLRKAYVIDRRCTWNSFNYTKSPSKRYDLLAKFGPDRFETNLEIVMDNMLVAYFKEFYSKQYSTQLSALRLELAYAKQAGHDIGNVIDVFDLAVRTKFYGESPIPIELQHIFAPLARMKSIFSMLQIGGKAVSMMKEIVYGTFIGFSNAWGKGLPGLDAETYWKAYRYVTSEVFKSMKGVGKLNHLQRQYHIANYGLSQVADQRRYNFLGWRNWGTDTLFLTATSPDFFHRSIILVAKMMADGTLGAYEFNEKANNGYGELKYNVMKDKRFSKFVKKNPDTDDSEYWQQKALFEQYINEFNNSGFTDENGNKLSTQPDANGNYYLPRAYVQREVDTFKNFADMLYGHYDDESKALINDTFLGAFWLQYKTFVTAKIERYGMTPGVYNTHLLQQQYFTDENGNKEALYLKTVLETGEDGTQHLRRSVIRESELTPHEKDLRALGTMGDPNTGESVTAYVKWEGIPMEGIIQSMASLSRTMVRLLKGDAEAWKEFKLIWDDPTKRGNFIVALNDLIIMGLLGMIGSTLFGMHEGLDFSEAWNNEAAVRQLVRAGNWAENGIYDIFVGAMQDGPITNTISSMFQAPPIMTSIERAWKDSVDLLTGESSAFEFLTSEVGALRIFDGMAKAVSE